VRSPAQFAIALMYGHQGWEVGGLGAAAPFPRVLLWRAGIAEAIGQFALVLGVFGMAVNKKAPLGWAGLVTGLNVAGLILVLGNLSGGAINPGRTVGPIFADWVLGGPNLWSSAWVYVIAQIIGALAPAAAGDRDLRPGAESRVTFLPLTRAA
jgi:glycerol uptake facilitator protein